VTQATRPSPRGVGQSCTSASRAGSSKAKTRTETTGYHLEQAYRYLTELGPVGDRERELASRAAAKLTKAGLNAVRHGDAAGAANLLSRGLDLLSEDAPERGDLLLALGDALEAIGDPRRPPPYPRMR